MAVLRGLCSPLTPEEDCVELTILSGRVGTQSEVLLLPISDSGDDE